MSEEAAKYETKKEPKKAPKKRTKNYKGLVMMDFKIEGESFKRGEDYSTKDEALFNKLIRLFKINKK